MEVITSPDFKRKGNSPVVLAIGAFDGLHLGHQKVIEKTISLANEKNRPAAVYSFYPHPGKIISPENAPRQLLTEEKKEEKLAGLGVDFYFKQKFDQDFAGISVAGFIKEILLDKIGVCQIVVGEDFRFGHRGHGDIKLLKEYGERYGFGVTVYPQYKVEGRKVSSSYIRQLVRAGQVAEIPRFLGSYYSLDGTVVHGAGRGKNLGYPTANLDLVADFVLPAAGVYAGYSVFDGREYASLANLGDKPTFADTEYALEIHLLNFSGDIYGKKISFNLIERIREVKKFPSSEDLKEQIRKDLLYTKEILC